MNQQPEDCPPPLPSEDGFRVPTGSTPVRLGKPGVAILVASAVILFISLGFGAFDKETRDAWSALSEARSLDRQGGHAEGAALLLQILDPDDGNSLGNATRGMVTQAYARIGARAIPSPMRASDLDEVQEFLLHVHWISLFTQLSPATTRQLHEHLVRWTEELDGPTMSEQTNALRMARMAEAIRGGEEALSGHRQDIALRLVEELREDSPAIALSIIARDFPEERAADLGAPLVERLLDAPAVLHERRRAVRVVLRGARMGLREQVETILSRHMTMLGRAERSRSLAGSQADTSEWLRNHPEDQEAALQLAFAWFDQGDHQTALATIRQSGPPWARIEGLHRLEASILLDPERNPAAGVDAIRPVALEGLLRRADLWTMYVIDYEERFREKHRLWERDRLPRDVARRIQSAADDAIRQQIFRTWATDQIDNELMVQQALQRWEETESYFHDGLMLAHGLTLLGLTANDEAARARAHEHDILRALLDHQEPVVHGP